MYSHRCYSSSSCLICTTITAAAAATVNNWYLHGMTLAHHQSIQFYFRATQTICSVLIATFVITSSILFQISAFRVAACLGLEPSNTDKLYNSMMLLPLVQGMRLYGVFDCAEMWVAGLTALSNICAQGTEAVRRRRSGSNGGGGIR